MDKRQTMISAATAAIATHTAAMQLDDDGRPCDVGMWHLLASLAQWADDNEVDFDISLAAAREMLPTPTGLHLVRVEGKTGEATVVMPVPEHQFEVAAESLDEACSLVVDGLVRDPRVARRAHRDPYTGFPIEPEFHRYDAVGAIREGNRSDIARAAENAIVTGFWTAPNPPQVHWDGRRLQPVEAAAAAMSEADRVRGSAEGDALANILADLMCYARRCGGDFDATLADLKEHRDHFVHSGKDANEDLLTGRW